jgi:hypothetical protein
LSCDKVPEQGRETLVTGPWLKEREEREEGDREREAKTEESKEKTVRL